MIDLEERPEEDQGLVAALATDDSVDRDPAVNEVAAAPAPVAEPAGPVGMHPDFDPSDVAVGHAPSPKDQAEVMQMFEEVNGPPAQASAGAPSGVGHAPSPADQAEVMQMFEEVNGPSEPAAAPAPAPGVGHAPSAAHQAEAMQMFAEVNGPPKEYYDLE